MFLGIWWSGCGRAFTAETQRRREEKKEAAAESAEEAESAEQLYWVRTLKCGEE
jgi:hypothetical protein